jgi:hypothetical protein
MSQTPAKTPLTWSELGVLGLVGFSVVIGLAASGQTLSQSLVSVGFLALLFLFAWLWRVTLQARSRAGPVSRGQRAWNFGAAIALLAVIVGLTFRHVENRKEMGREGAQPGANESFLPADQEVVADGWEQPAEKVGCVP